MRQLFSKKRVSCLMTVSLLMSWIVHQALAETMQGTRLSDAQNSEIRFAKFNSPLLGRDWTYNVYLPPHYQANQYDYPVLYLLHGNNGHRNDWVVKGQMQKTFDRLITQGVIPPTIVIMPDAGTSWYVDLKEPMERAFFADLIPHVEQTYAAQTTREGRLIAGLSMGGYGALRYVLLYPEQFQAAALLSPAVYAVDPPEDSSARSVKVFTTPEAQGNYQSSVWQAHNYPALIEDFLAKNIKVPMYINSGDDDEFMIEHEAVVLYELLRKHKQPAELRIVDGAHSWDVWASTLDDALEYIYRTASRPNAVQALNYEH